MSINNMKPEATITITTKRTPAYCYVIMAGAAVLFVGRALVAGFFDSLLIDICAYLASASMMFWGIMLLRRYSGENTLEKLSVNDDGTFGLHYRKPRYPDNSTEFTYPEGELGFKVTQNRISITRNGDTIAEIYRQAITHPNDWEPMLSRVRDTIGR